MKAIWSKIWNWKYRNHAICFIVGLFISTIFWLSIGSNETKVAEKLLEDERKITEKLKEELKPVTELQKGYDSLEKEIIKLKATTEVKRETNFKDGKAKINNMPFEPNDKLQQFITKWARENGGNVAE